MKIRKIKTITLLIILNLMLPGCNGLLPEKKVKNNVSLEDYQMGGIKQSEALQKIKYHSTKSEIEPINAKVDEINWEVKEEQTGKRVNVEKTLKELLDSKEGKQIKLVIEEVKPKVYKDVLERNIVEIGSYTTPLLDSRESRMTNIEVASNELNNIKVLPGQEFSFNTVLGKRTKQKGYEQAPIIIKTSDGIKKSPGLGGGICQISTTLYNAVEKARLEVTERHMHSKKIGYAPKGKDATVAYGSIDFKFKNNHKYPIMIKVYINNQELTVKIFENRN